MMNHCSRSAISRKLQYRICANHQATVSDLDSQFAKGAGPGLGLQISPTYGGAFSPFLQSKWLLLQVLVSLSKQPVIIDKYANNK